MYKKIFTNLFCFLFFAFCLLPSALFGQVTIGKNEEPKSYSVLELYAQYETGTFGGFRLPQLTTTQRDALGITTGDADALGLMIYNTTTDCIDFWNGTDWISYCENTGSGGTGTVTSGNYVEINGVKWAFCNVDMPGTFAPHPYDFGMLYQWNRKICWSRTDPLSNSAGGTTWDSSGATGDKWEPENDPCPTGWRVPTQAELGSLEVTSSVTRIWVTNYLSSGVNGALFTDINTGNTLFLPAISYRESIDGSFTVVYPIGTIGNYWSSTSSDINAYAVFLNIDTFLMFDSFRAYGFSVRCVIE